MPALPFSAYEPLADPMSEKDHLRRHIEVLKEIVRLDWLRMAQEHMTPEERSELREEINATANELVGIASQLTDMDASRT
jgi:hypothetical protein